MTRIFDFITKIRTTPRALQWLKQNSEFMLRAPSRTRWAYHYYCLKRLLEMQLTIRRLLDVVDLELELSIADWRKIGALCELLEPLASAVLELQGENYVTISRVIPSLLDLTLKMNTVSLNLAFYNIDDPVSTN